jgi:hypothetical protein
MRRYIIFTLKIAYILLATFILLQFLSIIQLSKRSFSDFPNIIGVWWWIHPSYITDADIEDNMRTLRQLGFTTIFAYDAPLVDGVFDEEPLSYRTYKIAQVAIENGLYVVPVIVGTGVPSYSMGIDWDNRTFRVALGQHLQKLSQWMRNISSIIGFCLDDAFDRIRTVNDTSEWDSWFRSQMDLGRSYFIQYDDGVDTPPPQLTQAYTITSAYSLYLYDYGEAWKTDWILRLHNASNTNYPAHALGIVLNTYEMGFPGWSLTNVERQIQTAQNLSFMSYSYYSWRRGEPETEGQLYHHPELWAEIMKINAQISQFLNQKRKI